MAITGSRRLIRVLDEMFSDVRTPSEPRAALVGAAAKESGEAVASAIGEGDPAKVAKEAGDAEAAFRRIRQHAEGEISTPQEGAA